MCDPYMIAATTMTAISTGAQVYGQQQQYEAAVDQAEAQRNMYKRNRQNTYKALGREYGDINTRQIQEQQKATEEKEERTREARSQMARARVSAGEAGITGNSVSAGLRDISGAAARDRSTIDRNLNWTLGQLQRQKQSRQTQAVNRINSVPKGQAPSKGAAYAGMASTAASGATQVAGMQPQNNSYGSNSGRSYGGSGWANQTYTR
ncbi:hypothetical protein OM427_00020 [Halomonas sp. 18H]|uniref:virion core protein, T7 gp14 family n=1 Tax=Halomonas sp. A40-4 TaxID=2785909 RepID=UPI0018F03512|nr:MULTISPECIES: hypothetical protein [unclassified Halomonas]MCW4147919.1 hypothetical protein [Halomonas sp. 18H]QPL44985.1 hypothetical protein IT895_12355 [Halomonas sp. A40-4]